mgnify:CR=1 FL=1
MNKHIRVLGAIGVFASFWGFLVLDIILLAKLLDVSLAQAIWYDWLKWLGLFIVSVFCTICNGFAIEVVRRA